MTNQNPLDPKIAQNFHRILSRIASAARSVNREPSEICLVVVTKGHSLEKVKAVVAAGAKILGENYVEEALPKMEALNEETEIEWHMIGHVQSRKAHKVCKNFSYVHSLDSVKLARRLDHFAEEIGIKLPVLLECNVSGEETKFGWQAFKEDCWFELLPKFDQILELPNIEICGLMTMAPLLNNPEGTRPYFSRLFRLRNYLIENTEHGNWTELSMGMSADFEVAIQEGATLVRIGTAIMGERDD
jgi:pyridoxal phosphate enzyme (YggS family)